MSEQSGCRHLHCSTDETPLPFAMQMPAPALHMAVYIGLLTIGSLSSKAVTLIDELPGALAQVWAASFKALQKLLQRLVPSKAEQTAERRIHVIAGGQPDHGRDVVESPGGHDGGQHEAARLRHQHPHGRLRHCR